MSDNVNESAQPVEAQPNELDESSLELESQESNDSSLTDEQSDQLKDEVQEAIENGASKKEVQNMIKEFHLKVNGKDYIKKLDLSDEEAVKRELQKALAGQFSMEREALSVKQNKALLEKFVKDPFSVMQELGEDPEEIALNFLKQRAAEMEKSPEVKEREELQKRLMEREQELERIKQEKEQAEIERYRQEAAISLNNEIIDALSTHKDLPNTPKVVSLIASTLHQAINKYGEVDATVEDVIPTVRYKLEKEMEDFMNKISEHPDLFEKYVGKKHLENYRNKTISKLKSQPTPVSSKVKSTGSSSAKKEQSNSAKRKTIDDFLRQF